MPAPAEAIDELVSARPEFHGPGRSWGLAPATMRWLAERVEPGWRTIETGCGHSTALFTVMGADHTVISPDPAQHEAVSPWCEEFDFPNDRVTFVAPDSKDAPPALQGGPFDLALIDGGHAFPTPVIDWYYLAIRLRPGGLMVIDDVTLRAPRLLRDFLAQERGRWAPEAKPGGAVVFRKLVDGLIPGDDWVSQPWSKRTPLYRARDVVRLRTRLRALARRAGR